MPFAPLKTAKSKRVAHIEIKGPRDKTQQARLKKALEKAIANQPGVKPRWKK